MDQETKDLLLKYLQAGADRIERGSAFVEAEIPLVVTEYLNWCWAAHLCGICLGVLLIAAYIPLSMACKWSFKKYKDTDEDGYEVLGVILGLSAVGLVIAGTVTACFNTYQLVKVSVAPRVVLLEKIAEIAK